MACSAEWPGFSFKNFKHYVYKWPHTFEKGAGNYIFCAIDPNNIWSPIYIGETGDLSEFLDNHHKMQCITQNGVTHIHAHTNRDRQARVDEKDELIKIYHPICND